MKFTSAISVYASVIPLKTELAYKILERGRVRLWLQAENISSAVTYKFFANNKELVNCEVSNECHTKPHGQLGVNLSVLAENYFRFYIKLTLACTTPRAVSPRTLPRKRNNGSHQIEIAVKSR